MCPFKVTNAPFSNTDLDIRIDQQKFIISGVSQNRIERVNLRLDKLPQRSLIPSR